MKDKYKVQLAHSNNSDDEFDLDIQIREVKSTITGGTPPITSISLCTPGCVTGILMGCNNQTASCNCGLTNGCQTGGCSGICNP